MAIKRCSALCSFGLCSLGRCDFTLQRPILADIEGGEKLVGTVDEKLCILNQRFSRRDLDDGGSGRH